MLSAPIPAQRSGRGRIVARRVGARTELAVCHALSPLRFVRPSFAGASSASVCAVTLGAGLVDGDAVEIDVEVERGATLVLYTQSPTKVFRGRARQALRADVAGTGTLLALPDPVAAFAGASFEQRVDVALHGRDARCVMMDGFTSGRAAFGERWAFDRVDLRTTIRRDGVTLLRDAVRLDAHGGSIARRMDRFDALLTVAAAGAPAVADAIRGSDAASDGLVVAASAREEIALARIAATSPERALAAARRYFERLGEMGAVDPFAARH